jgi:hypothetical protein
MDIDKLTDEVVRRLLLKIREEQDIHPVAAVSGATIDGSRCEKTRKIVVTEDKAMNIAQGSRVTFPKGTIITPLAKDALKERGITIEFS